MNVTLTADNGLELTLLLDEASPVITDGYGGWETVSRPKRVALTRYAGRNPVKQDIAFMFDGWGEGISQEPQIGALELMSVAPGDLAEPPKITLSGMALKTELTWVVDSIDWDNQETIWSRVNSDGPVRLRQKGVLHLIEFVDDTVITTPAQPVVLQGKKGPAKKITTPDGMTIKQVAQLVYNDPDKWMIIYNANPELALSADPRQFIPAGTVLIVPNSNVGPTFVVP